MTDDIITRLVYDGCDEPACGSTRGDAVIEIEQLQMEIARLDLLSKFLQAEFNAMHKERLGGLKSDD